MSSYTVQSITSADFCPNLYSESGLARRRSVTTVYQFMTLLQEEILSCIQHAQEGEMDEEKYTEMDEEKYTEMLEQYEHEEVDSFASNCGSLCAKKFVEQYGTFKAITLYKDNYGSLDIPDNEDRFYRLLLCVILSCSDEIRECLTYESYQTYCEANPLD